MGQSEEKLSAERIALKGLYVTAQGETLVVLFAKSCAIQ